MLGVTHLWKMVLHFGHCLQRLSNGYSTSSELHSSHENPLLEHSYTTGGKKIKWTPATSIIIMSVLMIRGVVVSKNSPHTPS